MNKHPHRIVVAVTGASGSIYADLLLKSLFTIRDQWSELGLVMSENASYVWQHELGNTQYEAYKSITYHYKDFKAPFASGSAGYNHMIVVPCSMGTLGRIAHGISNDLISRAADVMLKERGKLICVVRETPYNHIHIKNMEAVSLAGGIICPATPSFYHQPKTIEDCVQSVVNRVVQLMGLSIDAYRWGNPPSEKK